MLFCTRPFVREQKSNLDIALRQLRRALRNVLRTFLLRKKQTQRHLERNLIRRQLPSLEAKDYLAVQRKRKKRRGRGEVFGDSYRNS